MTDPNEWDMIQINGIDLPRTEEVKYFGFMITPDRSLNHEVTSRTNDGWQKWQTTPSIMCDKKDQRPFKVKDLSHCRRSCCGLWIRMLAGS
ncbi:hypothetical protein JRQ81_011343 [Phrynocephalus forsythii]|uniref:Uncharacterized protein n=1 Tax=Phrynocephalus forsythii TaxID=171643 RepID=A0A9Q0Y1S4_9SAUR|nr:hypothetical protein JRQ81_011343 [Phrynocephalus forsythii]